MTIIKIYSIIYTTSKTKRKDDYISYKKAVVALCIAFLLGNTTDVMATTRLTGGASRQIAHHLLNGMFEANLSIGYTNTKVNVRSEPNVNSDIVKTYKINKKVKYLVYNEKWVEVYVDGELYGYISSKYIQDEKVTVSNSDVELLARLIWLETGSLGDYAMELTANVIVNRIESNEYPNTLYDVIYDSGQWAVTWNGAWNKTIPKSEWKNAKRIAKKVLLNGSTTPSNLLYYANFTQGSGVYYETTYNGNKCFWCLK